MKLKIKKGQKVKVIAGNDKGKTGEVIEINVKNLQVKVAGVAVRTHFDKKEGQFKKEAFIDYSNVASVK
jgi:large subunit ribosomal protein L24